MSATLAPTSSLPIRRLADTYGRAYLVTAFLARLPQAMLPLGVLLLVSDRSGSFALAGAAVAAMSVGAALGGVAIGHLSDRYGHRRVGLIATTVLTIVLIALVVAAQLTTETMALIVLAVAVGATNPQIGSLARSRWLHVGSTRAGLVPTAMGYEAAADELSFVLGPVVVGLLAVIDPSVGLLAAAGLALIAQYAFALHRSAVPGRTGRAGRPGRAAVAVDPVSPARLPLVTLLPLAAVVACVGLVFGSSQTGVAARLASAGRSDLTGPVYACLGLGSVTAALLSGRLLHRLSRRTRIVGSALGLAVTSGLLALAPDPLLLAPACLLVGLTVAPVLVGAYGLLDGVVPPGRSATAMALLSTATVAGVAAGASGGGLLVDRWGPTPALLIGVLAGLLAAGTALRTGRRR